MSAVRQASLPGFDLGDYIKESIDFLRTHEPPEGYFVGFSGGKDSITTLELCKMAGIKHQAFYSCTRIDPPEIYRFISEHYKSVTWLYPKISFFDGIQRHCPPLRRARWCCDVIKKDTSRHIPLARRVMGIRAEESTQRAKRPRIDIDTENEQVLYKPIFRWPEWSVWEFIDARNLKYPTLYDEGLVRIGCVPCPYSVIGAADATAARRAYSMERWPGIWKAFEHAVKRWWENGRDKHASAYPGQTAKSYWQAYLNGFEK